MAKKATKKSGENLPAPRVSTEVSTELMNDFGSIGGSARDMELPRLLLMNFTSKLVKDPDSDVEAGSYIDSLTGKMVMKPKETLDIIVFGFLVDYVVTSDANRPGKQEFLETRPFEGNENLPREEEIDSVKYQYNYRQNFYCMLVDEIASGMAVPKVVSFQRTNLRCGKKIVMLGKQLEKAGLPLPAKVLTLKSELREKGDESWYVADLVGGVQDMRDTTLEERKETKEWYDQMLAGTLKAHENEAEVVEAKEEKVAEPVSERSF